MVDQTLTGEREHGPLARLAVAGVAVLTVALAIIGVGLQLANPSYAAVIPGLGTTAEAYPWIQSTSAILFAVIGWYLATRRPSVMFGPLALAAGLGHALAGVGVGWALLSLAGSHQLPGTAVGFWLFWAQNVELPILALIYVLFPDGEWPQGWLRWVGLVAVGLSALGVLHTALSDPPSAVTGGIAALRNPLGADLLPQVSDVVFFAPGGLLATFVVVVRWRQAEGELRQVLRWLAVVAAASFLDVPAVLVLPGGFLVAQANTLLRLSVITAAVLRHQVYGIHVVLNRALVYTLLTAVIATVYGTMVLLVALLGGNVGEPWTVVAAIVAAFSLTPARQLVQRLVNRFLYGQRDEPYAVLSQVASRLETAVSAQQLLPDLLVAVTEALRLPFAAIELGTPDGSCRRILRGSPGGEVDRFPLVHQGDQLGALIVGRRPGQGALNPGERQLLQDLARQAAVAASNVALTEALLRSRERIVNAAEEERRRLRRDLHDGLGPVLTAAASKIDASRNLLQRDVARVDDLLCDVRSDLTGALEELRRLVYALRPPALDQLGLLGALREQASRSAVPVLVHAPEALPPLPAAVEVAAFRIVTEAITNVARHAAASSCSVSIACSERLTLEVLDDGLETRTWSAGVGLSSMRERVAELGGRYAAGPRAAGGGRVWAELPLSMPGDGS